MAPLRRYLRITRYSVLEVRIYLENPALASSWLLNARDPVLPRIIAAARPLVLPKLREEHERARRGGQAGKKKKGVRDVVVEDDFEVSIFLTDLSTRHSLVTKQRGFSAKTERMRSNSGKLTGWLNKGTKEQPHVVADAEADAEADDGPVVLEEEGENQVGALQGIPEAGRGAGNGTEEGDEGSSRRKRRRRDVGGDARERAEAVEDALFVSSSDSETFQTQRSPVSRKRRKENEGDLIGEDGEQLQPGEEDDKKKLAVNVSYDGFSIYGKILCLVVKRRGAKGKGTAAASGGQAMMENWVSTQAQQEVGIEDD